MNIGKIRQVEITEEVQKSYLNYAMSVIVARALPDVRDGLKPVHRRILYAMHQMGLSAGSHYTKSAKIVGETMGKFHPHGDGPIYDALVRLAQDFSMRYPLVDGQGNFGSVDGDPAAAMRYTECRLTKLAEEMLEDIDKRTVKFTPNFDNSTTEPIVLPSKLPNLLINGSSGIAVGMATNIPPHNICRVIDAITLQIGNPDISIEEIMGIIQGQDFPTGALICGRSGIKEAYSTGRGKILLRAKTNTEHIKNKTAIIVSEIPFMLNKSELLEEMADLVRDKKIIGISDLRDESNRDGIRIVIELKKDSDSNVVLNQLFQHTRMQTTFGIIMLALINNEPKVMNIKQIIHYYIEHRKDVLRRRTLFDLNKAQTKAHILEGLIVALANINNVIKLIKESKSIDIAFLNQF